MATIPPSDTMKLRASRIGPMLSEFEKLRKVYVTSLQNIKNDVDHVQAWRDAQRLELMVGWRKASEALKKPLSLEIEAFEREEARLYNPAMLLYSSTVNGALPSETLAIKSEFRGLMQSLTPAARRDWFQVLAEEKDLGRIGVLVALEPSLNEDALALSIPSRDEALKIAAQIRGLLKDFHTQERTERMQELESTPNMTQGQALELIQMGGELDREQKAALAAEENTFTEAEQDRHTTLTCKAEIGQLSKAEGHELMVLSNKLKRKQDAENETKPPVLAKVTESERARFQALLAKANPSQAEGFEMLKIGNRIQAEAEAVK